MQMVIGDARWWVGISLACALWCVPQSAWAQEVDQICAPQKSVKIRATRGGTGFTKILEIGSPYRIVEVPKGSRALVAGKIDGREVVGWAMKRRLERVCELTDAALPEPPAPPLVTHVVAPRLLEDRASKLAVMDVMVTVDGLDGLAEALGAVISAELSLRSGGRYEVMTRGNLRSIVMQQAEAQQTGCMDSACLMDISKLASADHMVTAGVSQIGEDLVLTLELFDLGVSQVIRRQVVAWSGAPDGLLELSRPLVARLMDGAAASTYAGKLQVQVTEEGATVRLNEDVLGESPLDLDASFPIGKHILRVQKEGFAPYRRDIVIQQDELTLIEALLEDEALYQPWYAKWWVWTGASVLLAGAVTAAVLAQEHPTTMEIAIPLSGAE